IATTTLPRARTSAPGIPWPAESRTSPTSERGDWAPSDVAAMREMSDAIRRRRMVTMRTSGAGVTGNLLHLVLERTRSARERSVNTDPKRRLRVSGVNLRARPYVLHLRKLRRRAAAEQPPRHHHHHPAHRRDRN